MSDTDAVLVKTIITMAQNLNLHVVAEGVETEIQREFLLQQQRPTFQGFLFSRPVPVSEAEILLQRNLLKAEPVGSF